MAEAEKPSAKSEIDEIREEIKELRSSLEELKEVVAEIRASLSDLQNPFAVLSSPMPEPEKPAETGPPTTYGGGENVEEPGVKPEVKIPVSGVRERMSSTVKKHEKQAGVKPFSERAEKERLDLADLRGSIAEIGRAVREEYGRETAMTRPSRVIDVRRVIRILKTIYSLRKALPKESIENIVKLAQILGLISSEDKEVLDTVMSLVEDALKQDLTPDEQILVLYVLMKNLGYVDEDLEDEILKIVSGVILSKKKRKERENGEITHGIVGGS